METLHAAYHDAKKNNGAPGIDGVTFEDIDKAGVESFLKQIRDEILEIDVDNLTPVEALNKLYNIKKYLK